MQSEIDDKTDEKKKLENKLEKIRKAQQDLQDLGATSLPKFKSCIQILSKYWQCTIDDAKLIQVWLEKGADKVVRSNSCHNKPKSGVTVVTI